jgi:hypothetical protein
LEAVNDRVLADGTSASGSTRGTIAPRGRGGDGEPGRLDGDQSQQQGQAGHPGQGRPQQPPGAAPQQQRRPQQQQHPAVDGVGHRPAPEAEQDQRDQPDQPEHPTQNDDPVSS